MVSYDTMIPRSAALAETCRQAVGDLQSLLSALPVDLLNWVRRGHAAGVRRVYRVRERDSASSAAALLTTYPRCELFVPRQPSMAL